MVADNTNGNGNYAQLVKNLAGKKRLKGGEPIFSDQNSKVGILLLHGFTGTSRQFKEMIEFLAEKKITAYAPLVAGHGTSPEDLRKTTSEDWKESARQAYLKLRDKVDKIFVLGNSFGGNLAMSLAKEFGDDITGVISLGTPIFLKYAWNIKARAYTYGYLKKFYVKPQRIYKMDYTDLIDEITYPVIPLRSLRQFFKFIKKETIPSLKDIHVPTLIAHTTHDPVAKPKSARFIHQKIGSLYKMMYWFDSDYHVATDDQRRQEIFEKVYQFMTEVSEKSDGQNNNQEEII